MRTKPIVIGNWKMHKTSKDAKDFIEKLTPEITASKASVFIAAPFTCIGNASLAAENTNITVGAQNLNENIEGAFTGEISTLMLKAEGAEFVLLGHSERRHIYGESDERINQKMICPRSCYDR